MPESESEGTSAEDTSGEAPSEGTSGEAPSEGTSGEAPSEGTSGEAPSEGTSGEAPSEGTSGEAPDEGTTPAASAEPAPSHHAPAPKRLMRSRDDRVIAGVCGGLGEYLGVDAVLIRIAALILLFAGGAGFFLYVIGWIAMPEAPVGATVAREATAAPAAPAERTTGALVLGLIFVVIGAFFLLDKALPDFPEWGWIWPVALIAVGALVILRARR
jgi:phage shock protein C